MITKHSKGFTLVETLVAITILMIAIAGPLTVANKGYTASIDAKKQAVAMNLAQEGLEYLNHLKDNRIWGNWDPGTDFIPKTNIPDECIKVLNGTDELDSCTFDYLSIPGTTGDNASTGAGFNRIFNFELTPDQDQVVAIVEVTWGGGGETQKRVTLRQILSNDHR
jgi:prepilin-type N-terminal cleavage/methylation domain-containing protein